METKRVKVALFKMIPDGPLCVWTTDYEVKEREPSGYSRLSEWIEVDFPMLSDADLQARKQREVEAARKRLNEQLAALDVEGGQ